MAIIDGSQLRYMRLMKSLSQPAVLNWQADGRPESLKKVQNSEVKFSWLTTDLFIGKLRSQSPSIKTASEMIQFNAVDDWEWLNSHIFTIDNTSQIEYNNKNEGQTVLTCGAILKIILDRAIADGWDATYTQAELDALTMQPLRTSFSGNTYAEAIYTILWWQGDHNAYLNSVTKKFVLVNFNSLTSKSVYLGQLNQSVGTLTGSGYNVKSSDLNFTLAGCKTECIVEGGKVLNQVTESLVRYPAGDEGDWMCWKAANPKWLSYLPNADGSLGSKPPAISITVQKKEDEHAPTASDQKFINIQVNYTEGLVKTQKRTVKYWVTSGDVTNLVTTEHTIVFTATAASATYCYEGETFFKKYVATDSSAHQLGYDSQLYINESTLLKIYVNGALIRDDTAQVDALVVNLLNALKDEKIEGSVVIDMGDKDNADISWALGQRVQIRNSIGGEWNDIYTRIQSIEYRFDTMEVELTLSAENLPFGGSAYEERMRQLISQKSAESSESQWISLS